MASNYSDRYKLELQATGANANTWGGNTNTNLETIDKFSAGYLSKSVAGSADVTLTTNNADPTAEASNKVIEFTGALTGDIKVFIPAVESNYIFFNNTTGSHTLTVAPTGHASNGVAITQGAHTIQYCKGNKVIDLFASTLGKLNVLGKMTIDATVMTAANGTVNAAKYSGSGADLTGVSSIPSGSSALFFQAAAPTGWTQNTDASINTTTLRVVTGSGGGTGGSDAFSTTFTGSKSTASGAISFSDLSSASSPSNLSVGSTTLSTPTMASHSHPHYMIGDNYLGSGSETKFRSPNNAEQSTSNTGGGGGHTHPLSGSLSLSGTGSATTSLSVPAMNVKFANVVACTKD